MIAFRNLLLALLGAGYFGAALGQATSTATEFVEKLPAQQIASADSRQIYGPAGSTRSPAAGEQQFVVHDAPTAALLFAPVTRFPVAIGAGGLALLILGIIWFRRRAHDSSTPDRPEPPAANSAWPMNLKLMAVAKEGEAARSSAPSLVAGSMPNPNKAAPATITPISSLRSKYVQRAAMAMSGPSQATAPRDAAENGSLPAIEFQLDAQVEAVKSKSPAAKVVPVHVVPVLGAVHQKIRDRYIAARFPGVAKGGKDLQVIDQAIKAARLYFEDEQAPRAFELLEMAISQQPAAEPLWLAYIEILFLCREKERFCKKVAEFHLAHPGAEHWNEVVRLGGLLVPEHELFRSNDSTPRDHDHYGPWPDLPNWIQAPWDLTAEVVAAELHAHMLERAKVSMANVKPASLAQAA